MQSTETVSTSKGMLWTGRILSALPVLMLAFGGVFTILKPAVAREGFAHYGYVESALVPIVIAEIVCAILYAIPRTAVLGAILLTGYLGGATATHVRIGEQFFPPVILGIVVWSGLYLRDARLRALIPLRSSSER